MQVMTTRIRTRNGGNVKIQQPCPDKRIAASIIERRLQRELREMEQDASHVA